MKAASASALTGLSLVLGLICAIGGAQGIFVVEEASLVLLNTSLPEFAISLATFGVPQYGRDVTCVVCRSYDDPDTPEASVCWLPRKAGKSLSIPVVPLGSGSWVLLLY